MFKKSVKKILKQQVFKVYIAEYNPQGHNREHQALFIESLDKEDVGTIIQAMGDKRQIMWVDVRENKVLYNSANYKSKKIIGKVEDVNKAIELCKKVSAPSPKKRGPNNEFRDCQDWVNDAIKELKKANILIS
jgi:hypothetical protein